MNALADRADEGRLRQRYPRGVANRTLIRGFPNGETRSSLWAVTAFVRGLRGEVKHLSTLRKGNSVSSGERKRTRPNHERVIPVGGCVCGVVGLFLLFSDGLVNGDKVSCQGNRIGCRAIEGEGPVPERAMPVLNCSQVARVPWNPV